MRTADACVVGAGVIGCSIATELSRRGHRVLVVDKLSSAGAGSTSYSSGICRMMYSVADSVKFAWEGFTYYDRWAEHIGASTNIEGGLAPFRRCGGLVLRSAASETFLQKVMAAYDQIGLEYEELDAAALATRGLITNSYAPARRIDDDSFGEPTGVLDGAVHFPLNGYVSDPALAARNLHDAARATGRADFLFNTTVSAITRDPTGHRVTGVKFADGTAVSSPVVINAAGPGSALVTQLAFPDADERSREMPVGTRPMKQEVAYTTPPSGLSWCSGDEQTDLIITDLDAGVYLRPEGAHGEKLLIGSVEPSCDAPFHHYPADPESVYPGGANATLTEQWTNQVYRAALRVRDLPLPNAGSTQGFSAAYDVTPDWVPIYDHSTLNGYFMAIGSSGNQFKCAGVAGRLMATLVEEAQGGRDLDAHPLEFPLERIPGGHTISSATFSRKRQLLPTSGSVLG